MSFSSVRWNSQTRSGFENFKSIPRSLVFLVVGGGCSEKYEGSESHPGGSSQAFDGFHSSSGLSIIKTFIGVIVETSNTN